MNKGKPQVGRVSVGWAITVGLLWVSGPILPIMLGLPAGVMLLFYGGATKTNTESFPAVAGAFVAGFVLAWLWWSINVPKWRLWAYERVDDIATLKERAVDVGLTWPDGSIFEKAEIKSKAHSARERELERR